MAQRIVLFRCVGVEGHGDHVEPAGKVRGDVPAVDERAGAVGVHPGEDLLPFCLHLVDDPADVVEAVAGLAEAHEHQLLVLGEVVALDGGEDLLPGGLPHEPEVVGVDAAAVAVVPQAELAVEIAAVGGVHIQVVPMLIGDRKSFFHVDYSNPNSRFPFCQVISVSSSGVTPFHSASFSTT